MLFVAWGGGFEFEFFGGGVLCYLPVVVMDFVVAAVTNQSEVINVGGTAV